MRPSGTNIAAEADHKPLHPGIDAMAILEQAETEEKAAAAAKLAPRRKQLPSAAEVIAKTTARDHPNRGAGAKARRTTLPEYEPEPWPAPKGPVPVEPAEPIGGVGAKGLPAPLVDGEVVAAVLNADLTEPFSFFGMHRDGPEGTLVVRAFLPTATNVALVERDAGKVLTTLEKVHDEGLFVAALPERSRPFPYLLRARIAEEETEFEDPYRFLPVLTDKVVQQFAAGEYLTGYQVLGAHPTTLDGVDGTTFAVWAPNASRVAVVGEFNDWDGRCHGMRRRQECGVWEIFLPGVAPGALYKYEIKSAAGAVPELKGDPYAFYAEGAPGFASVVHDIKEFRWGDATWMKARGKAQSETAPLSFYEVHLGSWRRKPEEGHRPLSYREMAEELVSYVKDLGFTHVALLPISEHTYDGTLGYLPSSPYAPTGRFGTPDDLRYLIDACHRAGIGVVCDWVANYMSEESHGLARFDGTALYENPDPQQGRDPDWNTPVYDLARPPVASYLLGNALYWIDRFHLDGLRLDSLAKMLYLDYGRADGQWTPNKEGGNDNLEALQFIRRLNELVANTHPGTITIAEDCSLRQGITRPPKDGGLGFSFRWNTSWAYDTLRYLSRHPVHRKYYQFELTNPLLYAFDENFVLPLSYDHVSIGQGSMVNKLPGDRWQKFSTLRAWYALMYAMPGKKLLFMGTEFAQDREWNSEISLDWHLLEDPMHRGVQQMVRDLNGIYRSKPAMHEMDWNAAGFEWIDFADEDHSVIAFLRYSQDRKNFVVVVTHFTPVVRPGYRVGVPEMGRYAEIVNTDAEAYGGSNKGSGGGVTAELHAAHGREYSVALTLPPYATVILERMGT